jgi:hypothetical protein
VSLSLDRITTVSHRGFPHALSRGFRGMLPVSRPMSRPFNALDNELGMWENH